MNAFHARLLLFYQREKMSIHTCTWVGKMPLPTDVTTLRLCLPEIRLVSEGRIIIILISSSSSSSIAGRSKRVLSPLAYVHIW